MNIYEYMVYFLYFLQRVTGLTHYKNGFAMGKTLRTTGSGRYRPKMHGVKEICSYKRLVKLYGDELSRRCEAEKNL
jgi:hypothetical protein